jgi:TolB-like protein
MPFARLALIVGVTVAARAAAQCPNGTPPPCSGGDTRATAPLTVIKRAAPRALDDRTYIVMPFTNVTRAADVAWLSDAAVNMLSMDLARWQDIKVIDDRRVADYLRETGVAAGGQVTSREAFAVARRAGAGRVVLGEFIKLGNNTVVTAKVVNPVDDRILRTARAQTSNPDSLIGVFAQLARQLLGVAATDANAGSVGTSSVGAYKAYVAGNQALNRFDAPAAKQQYEAALALDSNFALAHYKWAIAASYDQKAAADRQAQLRLADLNNMARLLEDKDRITHAKAAARLASGLPPRERALIAGLVATVSYDYPRACESYRSLVRTDSSDVEALYGYGLCLFADDMVEPVVEGDTSRMRFRSSWNESLDIFRQAVSVDPTFHLAFDAIVSILTAPVRAGCARREVLESCADTSIKRRYAALVQRAGDSLVTTPRAGFTSIVDLVLESQRRSPVRANIELASRAAADWIALGPSEGRAHKHQMSLLLRLGRTAEAERELAEVMNDPTMRGDIELFLRRLEIALKRRNGPLANRLIDSVAIVQSSDLGRANAVTYASTVGRFRGVDSLYASVVAAQGIPPDLGRIVSQQTRIIAGFPSDSLGAMEAAVLAQRPGPCTATSPCARFMAAGYLLTMRVPRKWPAFDSVLAAHPFYAPAVALSRGDTASLRAAAIVLDSISRGRAAAARNEDGSTVVGTEAFLALGDSVAALRMVRRLTDSTLQLSGIEAVMSGTGGSAVMLWPRAILLRADLEAAKGDKQVARDYYTSFLALWSRADAEFAPLLARVRAARDRLP